MKRFVLTLQLAAIFIILQGCSRDFSAMDSPLEDTSSSPVQLSKAAQQVVASANTFSFDLFQETCRQENEKNIFISPLSASMALTMAYNGANGTTEEAMRTTLGYGHLSRTEINESCKTLYDVLVHLDLKVTMQIANSIWQHNTFSVLPEFVRLNQAYFYAPVTALDFMNPASVAVINKWCADHTNGRIDKILDVLGPQDRLTLLNALYFKGTWTYAFDKKQTVVDQFMLNDGSRSHCAMMRVEESFQYFETADLAAVEMPYGKGHFAMTLLVPKGAQTVDQLIRTLTATQWNEWRSRFALHEGVVVMPKLKLEYEITLNSVLRHLGMGIAFQPGQADFSGININDPVFISLVKQKTFLQVDEEGTEAAAVTAVVFAATSMGPMHSFYLRADRPFVMIIHDHATESILFIGKIVKP